MQVAQEEQPNVYCAILFNSKGGNIKILLPFSHKEYTLVSFENPHGRLTWELRDNNGNVMSGVHAVCGEHGFANWFTSLDEMLQVFLCVKRDLDNKYIYTHLYIYIVTRTIYTDIRKDIDYDLNT